MSDPKPLDYTATLSTAPSPVLNEQGIEEAFIQRLEHLKYQYRPVRTAIHEIASGAKVHHILPTMIGEVVVSIPTALLEQERIN